MTDVVYLPTPEAAPTHPVDLETFARVYLARLCATGDITPDEFVTINSALGLLKDAPSNEVRPHAIPGTHIPLTAEGRSRD